MFRFFRRLRSDVLSEKRSFRYVRYAIGELVLVVFGILIALQINNWNEDRIEQRQITEYAHALIKDLERDLVMAEVIAAEIDLLINKIDALVACAEMNRMCGFELARRLRRVRSRHGRGTTRRGETASARPSSQDLLPGWGRDAGTVLRLQRSTHRLRRPLQP